MAYSYAWKSIFSPGRADDFFSAVDYRPFEILNPNFSRTNAWWLSELSRLIYVKGRDSISDEFVEESSEYGADKESQTEARNIFLNKMGLKERWFYNGRYVQCAIMETVARRIRPFTVLVFRGTQGRLSNWAFNLNTLLSPWPAGGRVHKGFKLILTEAWDEIESILDTVSGPLYYTGHSLGGALAVLAASLKTPNAVYTFGAPRVGNVRFLETIDHINIFRVVNHNDIVPGMTPFPGFHHAGEPFCLTEPKPAETEKTWFGAPHFLADHSPLNYSVQL